jgi:PLP dependent protein
MLQQYQDLQQRIKIACERVNRETSAVQLVWVSKNHPAQSVAQAYQLGARDFGENRIQEALTKFPSEQYPDANLHILGPIQSNKIKQAARIAHTIHSMHRYDQLEKLQSAAARLDKQIKVYIQINTSEEDQKSGVDASDAKDFLDKLPSCPNLLYCGMMTMGPCLGAPEDARSGFRFLKLLLEDFRNKDQRFTSFQELSMGMSDDLEIAIEEGSTCIRVGTALFGTRIL